MGVPAEVIDVYALGQHVQAVEGGMVNHTYFVSQAAGAAVLQRMAPVFGPEVLTDFDVVTRHLETEGWVMPRLIPVNGQNGYTDREGDLWRLSTRVEADPTPELNNVTMLAFAARLGQLHRSLATLDYEPQHHIPHFHDTPHYAGKLEHLQHRLPEQSMRDMAADVLDEYKNLRPLPRDKQQLIHADPRYNNALFRGDDPFTIIDWDTLMIGPTWLDVGDFVRSLAEERQLVGETLSAGSLRQVSEAYRQAACPDRDADDFFQETLEATKLITCELAMRFLNDVVEDSYFAYDPAKYPNRAAFVYERAQLQYGILQNLRDIQKETA